MIERQWALAGKFFDFSELHTRLAGIANASLAIPSVQRQSFEIQSGTVIRRASGVARHPAPSAKACLQPLAALAHALDGLALAGVVHGDIKQANTVWDGARWVLIDWEPLLVWQEPGGKRRYKVTRPYLHPVDERTALVSSLTDKVGFYFFARRQAFGWQLVDPDELRIAQGKATALSFEGMLSLALGQK